MLSHTICIFLKSSEVLSKSCEFINSCVPLQTQDNTTEEGNEKKESTEVTPELAEAIHDSAE